MTRAEAELVQLSATLFELEAFYSSDVATNNDSRCAKLIESDND